MSQPYKPTTEQVRNGYSRKPPGHAVLKPRERQAAEFDRWYQAEIAAAEQRGAIKALRSAADHLGNQGQLTMTHRQVHDCLNNRADRIANKEEDDD